MRVLRLLEQHAGALARIEDALAALRDTVNTIAAARQDVAP